MTSRRRTVGSRFAVAACAALLLLVTGGHIPARAEPLSDAPERCSLTVRNETSHEVEVYADGRFIARVAARETAYVAICRGETWLYGRATCHRLAWGPVRYRLGEAFVWPLTP